MDVLGFHHVALFVRDLERTAAFYREVLGLEELVRHRRSDGSLRSIWMKVAGPAVSASGFIALEEVVPDSTLTGEVEVGLALLALRIDVRDRDRIRSELERRGVAIEKQTRWTMYLRDPEGNRVGLSHHPDELDR